MLTIQCLDFISVFPQVTASFPFMFSPIKQPWRRLSKIAGFETSFLISDQACKCMFKVNNKDTRMTSIQGNQMYLHTYFTIYSVLSIPCIMVLVVSKQSIVFCKHFFCSFSTLLNRSQLCSWCISLQTGHWLFLCFLFSFQALLCECFGIHILS